MSSRSRSVRIRDVAAVAKVDPSVVSRILSGDDRLSVRPETRERVLDAVERLQYRPNRAARMLRTSRTMALGIIVPDLANATYAEISRGAEAESAEHGYILLVVSGSLFDRLRVLDGRVDGLLYAIATSEPLERVRVPDAPPSVLVNRHEPGLGPSVVVDDESAAALATAHLADLGHVRIGHIAGPPDVDTSRRRATGFSGELTRRGIALAADWIVPSAFDERAGHAAATQLLTRRPRPTAIMVANTRAAIGAIAAASSLGISIPQDVSIVGFDDIPVAEFLVPPLTTLRRPLAPMGARAVQLLLELIEGRSVTSEMLEGPGELVVRGSTAPPR
jgi:LacI family transcriptional regulator, galactose operon repressor